MILVRGYHTAADGGGGLFYWSPASNEIPNLGTIVAPASGPGRWKRADHGPASVRWFGARGDNHSDDTAAVQAALDTSPDVEIPAGVFLIAGLQVTGANGKTICGEGTLKLKAGKAPEVSDQILLLANCTDISISDITFDGNAGQHGPWEESYDCVKVRSCQAVSFRNVAFRNIQNDGIYLQSVNALTTDVLVAGCQFLGDNSNRNGISVISARRVSITGCLFVGMSRNNMPAAVDFEPNLSSETVEDALVANCSFINCRTAVLAYNNVAANCRRVVLEGNVIRNPALNSSTNYGYYLDRFNEVSVNGGQISDLYHGVWVSGCDRISIHDLRVDDWNREGYAFKFTATVTRAHVVAHTKGSNPNIMVIEPGAEVVWAALVDGAWRFGRINPGTGRTPERFASREPSIGSHPACAVSPPVRAGWSRRMARRRDS